VRQRIDTGGRCRTWESVLPCRRALAASGAQDDPVTRRALRLVARCLAAVVLLAQLTVSAYACPRLSSEVALDGPSTLSAVQPDYVGASDPLAANLCGEHCQSGKQGDQAPTLNLPALLRGVWFRVPMALPASVPAHDSPVRLSALVAASPRLTIAHCVFRI
jgi:hypothetical protein